MRFKKQTLKELLDKGASLIIDDELDVEELIEIAKIAKEYNKKSVDLEKKGDLAGSRRSKRHITILARNKGLEDLKKVAKEGDGCITIDVSQR